MGSHRRGADSLSSLSVLSSVPGHGSQDTHHLLRRMRVRPQVPKVEAATGGQVPGQTGGHWGGHEGDLRQAGGAGGGGDLLHSKMKGDGYVDTGAKLEKIFAGVEA